MPYSLGKAVQTFQRFMISVFRGRSFYWIYLDDLFTAISSPEFHKVHIRAVFDRLQEFGIRMNFDKCVLRVEYLAFLGNIISAKGFCCSNCV